MAAERVITVATAQEFDAVAHLRGWCHNAQTCPICQAERAGIAFGRRQAVSAIAEG